MARYPPAALLALLAVSSTGGGGGAISNGVSAYVAPTNFQKNQRRNNLFSLASSRSGSGTGASSSSTFRPLFDDDGRTAPLDGDRSRRIPQTGSTGGAVSLDQSSAAAVVDRLRPNNPNPNRAAPERQRPNTRNARDVPAKKKGPLWGMFPGNGSNNNGGGDDTSTGGGRVRLSDLGKDAGGGGPTADDGRGSRRGDNADGGSGGGQKKVWGGRYTSGGGASNSTADALTDSYYSGGPGPGPFDGPFDGPPPDEYFYDGEYDDRDMRMDGPPPPPGGGGGGVDAYGRPGRGDAGGRMDAPPREAPSMQQPRGGGPPPRKDSRGGPPGGGGIGGGRRPGGEPSLFDKVSNFVADSGTIAVLKTEIGFLDREIKARKHRFGVDVYDAIDQLEYEHETFLRRLEEEGRGTDQAQEAIDADLDRMEADKEFRIRRLYENARRDVVGFEREIGYKEEEVLDVEAAETEKQDAAWDEYRRPAGPGAGAGGINVGRKDKYVRVPSDPNAAMSNQQQRQDRDPYGRVPKTPPPMQQPAAQQPKSSVRLSDIGKEKRNNDDFGGGQDYFSGPLEGRGTRPQQERVQQPRGQVGDVGKQRQTIDEIFDNLDRRQGERRQEDDGQQQRREAFDPRFDRQEDFDRRFEDEFDDRMPPPQPRSSGFQQPPPQQPRESIVPPPPRQQEERQPIIPPPPRSSASAQQQRPGQSMNSMDVGRDDEWGSPSNGPSGSKDDEFDRYGRKITGDSGEWTRGDEWEPPRFEDRSNRSSDGKVY